MLVNKSLQIVRLEKLVNELHCICTLFLGQDFQQSQTFSPLQSFLNTLIRGFNNMKSRFGQIDRQAGGIPPIAGLMLAVSAAAGGMYIYMVLHIFPPAYLRF